VLGLAARSPTIQHPSPFFGEFNAAAGGADQRVGTVDLDPADHQSSAYTAQVRLVQTLVGGRLDGLACWVGRHRSGIQPQPRIRRHPAGGRRVEDVTHRLNRCTELACQTTHQVGDRDVVAELHQ
jgi:hypothetical protein